MKKALAIVMCIVAVCFASCNKEKSKQKFIGNYRGELNGSVVMTIPVIGEIPFDSLTMDLSMEISAGNADNKVVAKCPLNDEVYTINGTTKNNVVSFEPLVIKRSEEGAEANVSIDLTGTLDGNKLNVNGKISGQGTAVDEMFPTPVNVTISGILTGTLNKVAAQ